MQVHLEPDSKCNIESSCTRTSPRKTIIIFDLEVAFLIPWAINLKAIVQFGFWSMMVFLLVLTVGFIYEWKKGALDWE